MLVKPTVGKTDAVEPALNQKLLYLRGLDHVRQLARQDWTDHNIHDPGITTLELLSYTLTDLGYRTRFPVADLLAAETGNAAHMARQFFSARRVLPVRALTALDYRKLIIDLPGVKNAWIRPAPVTYFADTLRAELLAERPERPGIREVHLRGLSTVLIEYMDDVEESEEAAINARVLERLHANRNLAEDFAGVERVPRQPFRLCGELELAPDADTAMVVARVLDVVQQYLAPPVKNYTLAEMLQRTKPDGTPYTVPEIFDGPALDCGFIDSEELAASELRTEIRLSDVISEVMDVAGVRAVREILINPLDQDVPLHTRWLVPVAAGMQATLDPGASRLVLYKRNMPVVAPPGQVEAYRRQAAEAARVKLEAVTREDIPIPQGRYRRPDRYYSFQNHFPAVYGVGEVGPPSDVEERRAWRRAVVFQLKGYLLFFDQIMANFCAQLAHLPDLFSMDPDVSSTYFSQAVDSFLEYLSVYRVEREESETDDQLRSRLDGLLQAQVENDADAAARRQRFLDHLIARFAENFGEYVAITRSLFGASDRSLITDRCAFLQELPETAAMRGAGYNYALADDDARWDSDNVSGLERRVARLLGIATVLRRNLSTAALGPDAVIAANDDGSFRFELRDREDGGLLLSSAAPFATEDEAASRIRLAVEAGQLRSAYRTTSSGESEHSFDVVSETDQVEARGGVFATPAERDAAIVRVVDYLQAHYSREGLFVIENILLRPGQEGDPFLPICVDPNCTGCEDDEPYSFRIHVVLPAYAGRFRQMEFRRFVEEVIREETPAHILPKVCWIAEDDMAGFEAACRDWIDLRSGASEEDRAAKLTRFRDLLYSLKNVYPVQKLADCSAPEDQPKFILGRTALGSSDTVEE